MQMTISLNYLKELYRRATSCFMPQQTGPTSRWLDSTPLKYGICMFMRRCTEAYRGTGCQFTRERPNSCEIMYVVQLMYKI